MATTASFDAILKRYMPYSLLMEEMKRRNYFWGKVKKKADWHGGTMEIPFEGAEASSLSFGSLTSSTDIAESQYVMGTLSTQPELWGTMKFNEKDLDRHQGNMEASYLSIAPAKIKQFVERMSERVSISLLSNNRIDVLTATGTTGGVITVAHPERFALGEKIYVDDSGSSPASGYVRAIDINAKTLTIYDARTAGSVVDLSGYAVNESAAVYLPGQQAGGFTSLASQLLTSTNGGSTGLFGQSKTAYPHLQALNIQASGWDKDTILSNIFDAYYQHVSLAKGSGNEMIVPYQVAQYASIALEGNRRFAKGDTRAGYGFTSIDLLGPGGQLTLTGVRDLDSSLGYIVDWDALCFHGSKFFERKRFDGSEYFKVRETSGYSYLVDVKFYGDLVCSIPSHCSVIHSIPTLSST